MSLPWGVLVFLWLVPGLGLLTTRFLRLPPQDRLVAIISAGIILLGLGGQVLHITGASPAGWRILALVAAAGWALHGREAVAWWRCPQSRLLLRNWLIVATGCLGALALIRTYSGGDWIGDWVGHYHRAHYFLHQDPAELWIFTLDPFTARPPLLNLATSALMAQGDDSFAAYQVYTTMLGSVAVLPFCRLVVAAGGCRRALALVPLLLLVNPLFMQNATYSWTKLGAAAFVLTGVWFFRRAMSGGKTLHWKLSGLAFSAAVLAHYSSAPYALAAVAAYGWLHRNRWGAADFWSATLSMAFGAILLSLTWIGWAIAKQGFAATVLANTSVQQAGELSAARQLQSFALNLWHTVLPPPWPGADMAFLQHGDALSTLRDRMFVFAQTSLPGMAGCGGLIVLLWWLGHRFLRRAESVPPSQATSPIPGQGSARATSDLDDVAPADRCRWIGCDPERPRHGAGARSPRNTGPIRSWLPGAVLLVALIVVGVAVHPGRMRWGAGHICLQPLALGFAAVAIASLPTLPNLIRRLAVLGWLVDAGLGVGLHLFIEHRQVSAAVLAMSEGEPLRAMYGLAFGNNAAAKHALGLTLLGDTVPLVAAGIIILGALLTSARTAWAYGRVLPSLPVEHGSAPRDYGSR